MNILWLRVLVDMQAPRQLTATNSCAERRSRHYAATFTWLDNRVSHATIPPSDKKQARQPQFGRLWYAFNSCIYEAPHKLTQRMCHRCPDPCTSHPLRTTSA